MGCVLLESQHPKLGLAGQAFGEVPRFSWAPAVPHSPGLSAPHPLSAHCRPDGESPGTLALPRAQPMRDAGGTCGRRPRSWSNRVPGASSSERRHAREERGTGPAPAGGGRVTRCGRRTGLRGGRESEWPLAGAFLGLSCRVHRPGRRAQDACRETARSWGGGTRTRWQVGGRWAGAGGSQSEPPLRASAPQTPPQLRPPTARRPAHPSAKSTGALGPDSTRADRTRRGAGRLEPERRMAASRPGSHPQPTPPSPRGSPGLPPGIATQPSAPRRPAPDLAVYLSSSPRRAPGRPRPRGDIRALGSGSRPHLQAPVAAWEAPRPATGGGSAEPALPAPSQCPLAGLAPSPEGVHLFPRRAQASCFGPEKRDRKGRKADLRAREPAPSVTVPGASSAPVMRRPGPGGPDNPVGGEAPEGHLLSF